MNRKKLLFIISFAILLVVYILFVIFKPRNQRLYKITILPTLGGKFTFPTSINDKGQVAGYSQTASGKSHLFIWDKESGIQDLGPVERRNIYINNASQIAGGEIDPNGNKRVFLWDPNNGRTILPTLGGKTSTVFGINNHGEVIGYSDTYSGVQHAFVWDKIIGIRDLTPASTNETHGMSINDAGQVIVVQDSTKLITIDRDKNIVYPAISLDPMYPVCHINNNGYVIGLCQNKQNILDVALWDPASKKTSIVRTSTSALVYLYHINDLNQIIITELQKSPIFGSKLFPPETKNDIIDPDFGTISLDAYLRIKKNEQLGLKDINNKGWIIGVIESKNNSYIKGALFEPIPEKMEKMRKKSNSD